VVVNRQHSPVAGILCDTVMMVLLQPRSSVTLKVNVIEAKQLRPSSSAGKRVLDIVLTDIVNSFVMHSELNQLLAHIMKMLLQ